MNSSARRLQEYKASRDYQIFKRSDQPAKSAGHEPSGAAEEATTLDELEATARTYRRIYESFYQAFTEAVQRGILSCFQCPRHFQGHHPGSQELPEDDPDPDSSVLSLAY